MAGAVVGVSILTLHGWLTELYQLSGGLVLFIGIANLTYAGFSFTLAQFRQGDHVPLLRVLAVANVFWGLVCAMLAVLWASHASIFGMFQLISESMFVGGLGIIEWKVAGQTQNSTQGTSH